MKSKLLFCLSIALITTNTKAQNFWKGYISGEGPIVKKELSFDAFDGIRNGINSDIFITRGHPGKVTVEGQENILENLIMEVSGGILKIKFDKMVRRADPVKIYLTMETLTEVSVSGSGSLVTTNSFSGLSDLNVSVSGSGDISLDVAARDIHAGVSGSGDIKLRGNAEKLNLTISGSGSVDAMDLATGECQVSISGSGNATIYVHDELEARVSGSGHVRYKGDVARIHSRVSGSGKVRSLD
jgi:hypothetical protein